AREVLALVAPQARAQQVEVRARADQPAPAKAEELLLEQVFLNLVRNALQAMPTGGVLTVDVGLEGDFVVAVVSDTGPGIPEAMRNHLFQPFRRDRPDGAGTGLGLFLCHTLVRRCGGAIAVASEPGKGTTFHVRLRRSLDRATPRGGAVAAPEGGNGAATDRR
ncbi:MAG: HAMP domain-containing sensor histidine kinase, partial [Myxococcota bacterium]|nr:HAMP domain-containing sensor histidine kinase [Myxococcota bacterium]